ncbi:MAG: TIGR02391 family protein [Verrucomicrobiota bacterium]
MPAIPPLDETKLEAICEVLGETDGGLTGSEIARYLRACDIPDLSPTSTKRHRLYDALRAKQREDRCANNVFGFVTKVMNPVLYHANADSYDSFRARLNTPLAFCGYQVNERGEISPVTAARTLTEAEQRANRLQGELRRRMVHPDVLRFCRAELVQENYFHAVLEATKSVSEKVRAKSALTSDAGELVTKAFSLGQVGMPFLAFNSLRTDTEKSEQSGLMNLFLGMFGAFRNVTAHGAKISWNITEQDALDLLTLVSMLHRRLDAAVFTGRKS